MNVIKEAALHECFNDGEVLAMIIKSLGLRFKRVHIRGIGEVLNAIRNVNIQNSIVLVDGDVVSEYFTRLSRKYGLPSKCGNVAVRDTVICTDEIRKIVFIMLNPRVEEWLVKNCDLKISPEELHRNRKRFKECLDKCRDVIDKLAQELREILSSLGLLS